MARKYSVRGKIYLEDGERKVIVGKRVVLETTAAVGGTGVVHKLASNGGLAGLGGLAGRSGGMAG